MSFGQTDIKFDLHMSEPYAVYDFLQKISDSYPDNALKDAFAKSVYNTPENKEKISSFERLAIDYSYFFNQYPQPLKSGVMVRDLLEKNLAASKTVAEFTNKSVGLVPNETLISFAAALTHFQPVYNTVVYTPNKQAIAAQEEKLKEYITSGQFQMYLRKGLAFYNAGWDTAIPFQVNLLPSLDRNSMGARAFFNVAVCEVPLSFKDHNSLFSVIMHEIYHIAYDNQSLELKTNIRQWFDSTGSPNSQYALLLLNEVLATAMGNAYVPKQLKGKVAEDDWYDNTYITSMAKAIFPTVEAYTNAGKPIDEAFIRTYVGLYDKNFSQWNGELPHLLTYRYILADNPDDWRYIRRTYRYFSNARMGSPITVAELEKAKQMPITKVVIVSKNHREMLEMLTLQFDELQGAKLGPEAEFIHVATLKDRTRLILINRHTSTVEQLMTKYFPEQRIKVPDNTLRRQ
jgi:hypothetical protein